MWTELRDELARELARAIQERFGVALRPVIEVPPRRELGDLATPAPMQLARTLKRPPRAIAEELAAAFRPPRLVREVKVLGAGYLNLFLDRPAVAAALLASPDAPPTSGGAGGATGRPGKVIVEHTNINPNKAAHIGHLRNAVLGDVLAGCLRSLGHAVEVQNYIDDTGVQLADVVVGFHDLRRLRPAEVAALPEPFDYLCWDLYAEVRRWYDAAGDASSRERRQLVRDTLHELETGRGERAEMGRLVARRVVHRHLATMARLGIAYDLLTRESDILALHFFDRAFQRLKDSGAVSLETAGKNAGCWVMPLQHSEEFAGMEDPDKVIVRSDGTVTYVGKDIAYQLWKFGLLGQDFGYRWWQEEEVWETCPEGEGVHPPFGGAEQVINVIDTRQSYLQKIVRAGLQALGHAGEAERSVHFAYEMVALSPATARQLGYTAAEEGEGESDKALEMSGRKGIGVKADDLMDQLEAKSREKILKRYPDLAGGELDALAREIAVAALRFFMVKATTNRVIAFDFEEALNFEGESGPYLQYSLVRARNIRRRLREAGLPDEVAAGNVRELPAGHFAEDLWDLILQVAQTGELVERAVTTLELSLVARQALEIAQRFHSFYHHHPILQESDPALRAARLAAVQIFCRGLENLSELLGIPTPERM
ncbi:MAG TPA: arginine--tRNA ligase [Thermoanaerobaculia bacterium]|nr:arginine--tRNA ligase [Thermoanaerobaculia bacterium]